MDRSAGRFNLALTVYSKSWVQLPGNKEVWPQAVRANGAEVAVLEHNGFPSVQLNAGTYQLIGTYRWEELPQRLSLPTEVGILSLAVEGKAVAAPSTDAGGFLWLQQKRTEEAEKNFLAVKVYRLIEDGIPLWLQTEVELSVAGKSREETLGTLLPEGWHLSRIDSPIPVAVDEQGRMKAQVRAGKWTVRVQAFRLLPMTDFHYPVGATPLVPQELVAFRAQPELRLVAVIGVPSIDVTQTTFPAAWRELPVYSWENRTAFQLTERMRGMGLQKPEGLRIDRELWLDDNGQGLTFRDRIQGNRQQIWRLDAAEQNELGSVRSGGQGQLITRNPQTGAPGVEVRTRNLELEATGRVAKADMLSATGWRADAEAVNVNLNLPPGWRLFALFGADYVRGDWLTAWSLLDLFLLLIFALAVYRLWGIPAGLLALGAFALAYHEPGAPRYAWLFLLLPLALLRVVPAGWAKQVVTAWKYLALVLLLMILVPFIAGQIQLALYPQLEQTDQGSYLGKVIEDQGAFGAESTTGEVMALAASSAPAEMSKRLEDAQPSERVKEKASQSNLLYEAKARIQTGPGLPQWQWRGVSFGWNGPVQATQEVRPVFISLGQQRLLAVLRVALILALVAWLLEVRRFRFPMFAASRSTLLGLGLLFAFSLSAQAQLPSKEMLNTLRDRLLETTDAYPHAADIPAVTLTLRDSRLQLQAEIHTAVNVAVPLPGRLPAWSPVRVQVNGKSEAVLRRADGYLWVALPAGVHRVTVEGLLPEATEWEWSFLLPPRRVTIDAPGWTYNGVRLDGVPEAQVFFARQQKTSGAEASYDRPDYRSIVGLDRHLELGLVWQVRNVVQRLSPPGKAIFLRVPVLAGEKVLSSNVVVKEGFIEVRLGANEGTFTWESELPEVPNVTLATKREDTWVERWHLQASPVWNVGLTGIAPIYEQSSAELNPLWKPWPGEQMTLAISRPEAISGATMTVQRAEHAVNLGQRQRTSQLDLALQCSIGEDFALSLPEKAEITALTHNGAQIPVRKDGAKLLVPLRPGEQKLHVEWKTNQPLGFRAVADEVKLPVESANIRTTIQVPESRWVLWTEGPLRGPAVRLWSILAFAVVVAWVLGKLSLSPLRSREWVLLVIGLTQVNLLASAIIVGWLFLLAWRGSESFQKIPAWCYNVLQVGLVFLTLCSLGIFVSVVAAGLLGRPEMFLLGNGSSPSNLQWYLARAGETLPQPSCLTVSIWWYRLLMLGWALWLATALIRWLSWGWKQFSAGSFLLKIRKQ